MPRPEARSPSTSADDLPLHREAPTPASMSRLFEELDPFDPLDPEIRQLVICRLLEEGEREDLRWLASAVGEAEIASCFEGRAKRQISRRSSSFWSLLLKVAPPKIDPVREALWLL